MNTLKSGLIGAFLLLGISVMAQDHQGRNAGMGQRSPEEQAKNRVERLDKTLKLSQEQKDSIYVYALDASKKQQELFKKSDDRKANFEEMKTLRQSSDSKIKSFLTAEQVTSYEQLQKEMQEKRQQRQR